MGRCPPTGSSTIRGALSATSHCPQRRANIVAAASVGEQPVRQVQETTGGMIFMNATVGYSRLAPTRGLIVALGALALIALTAQPVPAQTYGFATLQPATLNHTTASAIAKVLKEKAGLNVLVQPTAGDQVIVPMVARGEAEIGISNAMEVHDGLSKGLKDLRIIAAAHALRVGFFVRKDSGIRTVADLKGKRVPYGFSAMRALEPTVRAILATAGLTEKDIKPVLVPNVIRSADDFVSGAADAFYFAFGAPKVREVDATVGGIRMTEISEQGMPAARKIERWGYLTEVQPGPVFVGVESPMKIYSFDNLLFTSAKTSDEFVHKMLDTLLKNQDDLIAVQPVLREFSAAFGYKQYEVPYHPGAVKYFKEHNLAPKALD
jgi:TRAP transporter TAXI family solute receptor